MDTYTETLGNDHHVAHISSDPKAIRSAIDKEKWIQKYAVQILNRYLHWQTPLGVAHAYTGKLGEDLAAFYDDPLKRMFVEATY